MLEFLRNNYRSWPDILDDDMEVQFIGPGSILGRPLSFGFVYEFDPGAEKCYNYAVLRWAALHIGRKHNLLNHSLPYYISEDIGGKQIIPVIPTKAGFRVPPKYRDFVVDQYGLLKSDRAARELAWRNIPKGTFERVSMTHANQHPDKIREAIVQSGIERARIILQFIKAEISRLDALWSG
jgi:hypothetical protein